MSERQPVDERLLDNYFISQYYNAGHLRPYHEGLATQLGEHGNTAFTKDPHVLYAHVPLAAASEIYTEQTLYELSAQIHDAPASAAVVSLNTPQKMNSRQQAQTRHNAEVVEAFIQDHPDIPLSYYNTTYEAGTAIGKIRNDLYASVIHGLTRQYGMAAVPDVLMTSWDADTLAASKGYFAETQRRYALRDEMAYRSYPMLCHTRLDNNRFPNANKLLAWYDLVQYAGRSISPAHNTVNLGALGVCGGMSHSVMGEQVWMWNSVSRHVGRRFGGELYSEPLERHRAAVSPRHLLGKMAAKQKVDYAAIQVAGSNWQAYPGLTSDVAQDVYNGNIKNLVSQVYRAAHADKVYVLMQEGADKDSASVDAVPFAENYLNAAAKVIGDAFDTRAIVDSEIKLQRELWLP